MMRPIERLEVSMEELEDILERAKTVPLTDEECAKLRKALETLMYLTDLVGDKDTTIGRLRKILFGASTEKTRNIVGNPGVGQAAGPADAKEPASPEIQPSEEKAKGHGRNGAADFTGATRIHIEHPSLKPGDRCPKCEKGKIYRIKEPAVIVRITGQAPIQATIYEMERWRCNLCGEVFTAEAPEGGAGQMGRGRVQHGRAAEVRDGHALQPSRAAAEELRDPAAGLDTVGDGQGGGGSDRAGVGGTDPAGCAGRGAA
jgi:transposase